MARRDRSTSTPVPAEAPAEATTPTEEAPVTTTTDAPAEAEASTTPAAPAPAAAPLDLTKFTELVEAALLERDETTGVLPLAALDPIQVEYRALDGTKAKNAARKVVDGIVTREMNDNNLTAARAAFQISEALTASGPKAAKESVPVDPTEAFVQKSAGLRLALNLATATVPEGVKDGWQENAKALVESSREQADAYLAWLVNEAEDKGDAPETPSWIVNAVKLSQGKSARVGGGRASSGGGSTYTGERRDIAKHIQSAFEGVESGTFLTIAEIRKHRSEEYGDNPPSAGAISARLFPGKDKKVTVEGVVPDTNEGGNKGARKA